MGSVPICGSFGGGFIIVKLTDVDQNSVQMMMIMINKNVFSALLE